MKCKFSNVFREIGYFNRHENRHLEKKRKKVREKMKN